MTVETIHTLNSDEIRRILFDVIEAETGSKPQLWKVNFRTVAGGGAELVSIDLKFVKTQDLDPTPARKPEDRVLTVGQI